MSRPGCPVRQPAIRPVPEDGVYRAVKPPSTVESVPLFGPWITSNAVPAAG
jgi:hypothetical protein